MTKVTNNAVVSSENVTKQQKWHMYLYAKDAPVTTEVQDRLGSHVEVRLLGGEKVLFGINRVSLGFVTKDAVQTFKFVWKMMNYCSKEETLSHSSALYRGLSFGVFDPLTAKYRITGTKLNGEYLDGDKELVEYFNSFIEDAVNNYIYDDSKAFEGSELLVKIPNMFVPGTTAVKTTPKEVIKKATSNDLVGIKLFEVRVDGSKEKYPVKRLKNMDMLGIVTPEKLIAFSQYDLKTYIDQNGFHSNVNHSGKTLDIRSNSMENFKSFKEIYCEDL